MKYKNSLFIGFFAVCTIAGLFALTRTVFSSNEQWRYQWITQSYNTPTTPDTTAQLTLTVRNTGNVVWSNNGDANSIKLGTFNSADRGSSIYSSTWLSGNRVSYFAGRAYQDSNGNVIRDGSGNVTYDDAATTVAPGEIAHFVFNIKTPVHSHVAREYFNLVADGKTWLNDVGLHWPINVPQGFQAQWVGQSAYPTIDKNVDPVGTFYFDYRNTGIFEWKKNSIVRLGTAEAIDRDSGFAATDLSSGVAPGLPANTTNWTTTKRPSSFVGRVTNGVLDTSATTIQPGETGRFLVALDARNTATGAYKEYFRLVADMFAWLNTAGEHMVITVTDSSPKIGAAGDIACSPLSGSFNGGLGDSTNCHMKATSDLLYNNGYTNMLALGDNQYEDGTLNTYQNSYDLSWGRFKASTKPVPGNHEYHTANASGYYQYFGALAGDPAKGYYSYDVGTWHIVALNSNCSSIGGCGAGSTQEQWLRTDLAAHTNRCTLAYWHHPRFSSGNHGSDTKYHSLWAALQDYGADVVLNGHEHIYERFHRQNHDGVATTSGIRQFTVGTGGKDLTGFQSNAANSAARVSGIYGVISLNLAPYSYEWQFVPQAGQSYSDSGSTACH